VLEVLNRVIRQEKERKFIHIGKKEIKLFLFANGMVLYIESPNSPSKLLELIRKLNKVTGYKINL
jgi:hypothetical protein